MLLLFPKLQNLNRLIPDGERGSGKTNLIYRVYEFTRNNLPNKTGKPYGLMHGNMNE
jgi:hypothetical protein